MRTEKIVAIVLAAGQGRRMNSSLQKQYMLLGGKPLVCYSLDAFEHSRVDEIILVVAPGEINYCKMTIVDYYGYHKVVQIIEGGGERYESVALALEAIGNADYVLIHDGARPFLTQDMIETAIDGSQIYEACVLGMPVKDTIKIADEEGYAWDTPKRELVWQIQTPQSFAFALVKKAYDAYMASQDGSATDDAMVVEQYASHKVKLLKGSYQNIKITTPEDLIIAEALLMGQDLEEAEEPIG